MTGGNVPHSGAISLAQPVRLALDSHRRVRSACPAHQVRKPWHDRLTGCPCRTRHGRLIGASNRH